MKIQIERSNQQGIAHLILILGIIVVVAVGAAAFRVIQHEDKNQANTNTNQQNNSNEEGKLADDPGLLQGIPLANNQNQTQPTTGTPPSQSGAAPSNRSALEPPTPKSSSIQGQSSQPSAGGSSPAGTSGSTPTSSDTGDTPQVTLTYPYYWGQTVSGTINMTATASDSSGVQKVVFMIRRIGQAVPVFSYTDTTAPYSASFDTTTLPNGGSDYAAEAQVFDNTGKGNLASYRITIQN